jgi:hypothetical protein
MAPGPAVPTATSPAAAAAAATAPSIIGTGVKRVCSAMESFVSSCQMGAQRQPSIRLSQSLSALAYSH